MEMFCTIKTAIQVGENVECSAFVLQRKSLAKGTEVQQLRDGVVLTTWGSCRDQCQVHYPEG